MISNMAPILFKIKLKKIMDVLIKKTIISFSYQLERT